MASKFIANVSISVVSKPCIMVPALYTFVLLHVDGLPHTCRIGYKNEFSLTRHKDNNQIMSGLIEVVYLISHKQ